MLTLSCLPDNFEGQVNRLVARNTSHGGGPLVYMQILDDWKAAGKLEGLELHHFGEDAKPRL
jgi:cyclohexanone monooxygenase